jgi:WhiB family transcriptional regulator, redox-sensing transcriptional regulator
MNAWQESFEDAGWSGLWSWRLRAACRDVDSAIFFSPDGERGPKRAAREAHAKAICAGCPVIRQCATHAIWYGERYGVWGGLSERERLVFRLRSDRLLAVLSVAPTDPTDEG